jgi:hypothetical protein
MGKAADNVEEQKHKDLYEMGKKDGRNYDYHDKGPSISDQFFSSEKSYREKLDNKEAYDVGYKQGNREHDDEFNKK